MLSNATVKDQVITAKLGEKTYTSSSMSFGGKKLKFEFDDDEFRINDRSIQRMIQKALRNADIELDE